MNSVMALACADDPLARRLFLPAQPPVADAEPVALELLPEPAWSLLSLPQADSTNVLAASDVTALAGAMSLQTNAVLYDWGGVK